MKNRTQVKKAFINSAFNLLLLLIGTTIYGLLVYSHVGFMLLCIFTLITFMLLIAFNLFYFLKNSNSGWNYYLPCLLAVWIPFFTPKEPGLFIPILLMVSINIGQSIYWKIKSPY